MASVNKVVDQLLEVLSHTKDRTVRLSVLLHAITVEAASSRDELCDYVSQHPETESLLRSALHSVSHKIPTPLSIANHPDVQSSTTPPGSDPESWKPKAYKRASEKSCEEVRRSKRVHNINTNFIQRNTPTDC